MGIFKAKTLDPFTQIPNKTLQDTSLSFEAKGLLCLILSLPEDWEIHKSWLQKQAIKCGQDKLKRLLKELSDSGYMTKTPKKSEDGKMAGWDWFVFPEKQLEPLQNAASTDGVKNRPSVSSTVGETPPTNKHINKETVEVVNRRSAEAGTFDFDAAFVFVLGLMNDEFKGQDLPEGLIKAIWQDYVDGATSPSKGRAYSFMLAGIQQHLATQRRSMAVSHSRDELTTARVRHISAQKTLADRKTAELEPRDRFDTSWADGLEMLEQAE